MCPLWTDEKLGLNSDNKLLNHEFHSREDLFQFNFLHQCSHVTWSIRMKKTPGTLLYVIIEKPHTVLGSNLSPFHNTQTKSHIVEPASKSKWKTGIFWLSARIKFCGLILKAFRRTKSTQEILLHLASQSFS